MRLPLSTMILKKVNAILILEMDKYSETLKF